jgi:hypothetical protein
VTVALRDLAAGEEITCNYLDYDADTAWKLGLVPKNARWGRGELRNRLAHRGEKIFAGLLRDGLLRF